MTTKSLDWARVEEIAKGMSVDQLEFSLRDIRETLRHADALDRELGGDRGGYYRDEASVYRRELDKRKGR
jgi:hypothetical protein